jgi:DNA-binding response OmpR family regulator
MSTGDIHRSPVMSKPAARESPTTMLKPLARVLSVSPIPDDHQALRQILDDPCWRVCVATGCLEAMARLTWDPIDIVICEGDLPDGSWRDLLRDADEYSQPLILIVTSRLADEALWAEVLNLGGRDVLAKPFEEHEVRRVLASAWDHRHRPMRARGARA